MARLPLLAVHTSPPGAAVTPRWFRRLELVAVPLFWMVAAVMVGQLMPYAREQPWPALAGAVAGFILADLVSGVVHWAADTWGSAHTPLVGPTILRPFREHHRAPAEMTRHDHVETNGASCLAALPAAVVTLAVDAPALGRAGLFLAATSSATVLFIVLTNQIHKWAHLEPGAAWAPVRWAQRVHLILPPEHHRRHHTPPYDTYYCITTGWLNPTLHHLRVFRRLERMVTRLTGAIPRKDAPPPALEGPGPAGYPL